MCRSASNLSYIGKHPDWPSKWDVILIRIFRDQKRYRQSLAIVTIDNFNLPTCLVCWIHMSGNVLQNGQIRVESENNRNGRCRIMGKIKMSH